MHSQRVRETPTHAWIIAHSNGTALPAHYDCMAGLGETCTHVAALLFSAEAAVRLRESKTPSQEMAHWVVPSTKDVQYLPISEIGFTSAKTKKRKLEKCIDQHGEPLPGPTREVTCLLLLSSSGPDLSLQAGFL